VLISDTRYVCDLNFADSGFFSHCSSFPLFFFWLVMDLSFIFMLSLIRFQKCFEVDCALAIGQPPGTHVRSFTDFGRILLGFFCSYPPVRVWYAWESGGLNYPYLGIDNPQFPSDCSEGVGSVISLASPVFVLKNLRHPFLPSSKFIKCRTSLCYLDAFFFLFMPKRLFVLRLDIWAVCNPSCFGNYSLRCPRSPYWC
jgi:hypothetical protein